MNDPFGGMTPKELRAMARKLNAMAQSIESFQNPELVIQKKMKSQVSTALRNSRRDAARKLGL